MTPKLRRSHHIIWLVLAVLLPAFLLAALLLPRTGIPYKSHATTDVHQRLLPNTNP